MDSSVFMLSILMLSLIGLQLKYFMIEDFIYYDGYRVGLTRLQKSWGNLLTHGVCHGIFTALILFGLVGWFAVALGVVDTVMHCSVNYWRTTTPTTVGGRTTISPQTTVFGILYICLGFIAYGLTI